jgi:uncharacterized protein (DUF924 family)
MNDVGTHDPAWPEAVLGFWFEELGPDGWFAKTDSIDASIRRSFLGLHERLVAGAVVDPSNARQVLAAVIVLDQFPRNMFRNTPRAYASDAQARELARGALRRQLDGQLTQVERMFLYLPFEHSEDRADQALSVQLIAQLGNDDWTRYALAHHSIIERFGRFPHRNAVLGRVSSEGELALLAQPMGSF